MTMSQTIQRTGETLKREITDEVKAVPQQACKKKKKPKPLKIVGLFDKNFKNYKITFSYVKTLQL